MNFYSVDDEYIKYISQFDSHIAYNKNNQRPYIGVILHIDQFLYFAPLFSPKPQHVKYRNNLSCLKIYGNGNENDYLGLIRFSDMIPIPKKEINKISIYGKGIKYQLLLIKQYNYINQPENAQLIKDKAKKLYDIIINDNKNKKSLFYKKICCNFKVLEEKCLEFNSNLSESEEKFLIKF